jgi:hypothetical protein
MAPLFAGSLVKSIWLPDHRKLHDTAGRFQQVHAVSAEFFLFVGAASYREERTSITLEHLEQ